MTDSVWTGSFTVLMRPGKAMSKFTMMSLRAPVFGHFQMSGSQGWSRRPSEPSVSPLRQSVANLPFAMSQVWTAFAVVDGVVGDAVAAREHLRVLEDELGLRPRRLAGALHRVEAAAAERAEEEVAVAVDAEVWYCGFGRSFTGLSRQSASGMR